VGDLAHPAVPVTERLARSTGTDYGSGVFPAHLSDLAFQGGSAPRGSTQRVKRVGRWLLVSVGLTFATSSCQSLKSVSRCNDVLGQINATLERARELHGRPPTSSTYRELSEAFGQLEAKLVEQNTEEGEVARAAKSYAKHLRKVNREARNFAQSLERLEQARAAADAEKEKKAMDELGPIRVRAERLLEGAKNEGRKLRDTCRPKS
jgi:hypothetical protein